MKRKNSSYKAKTRRVKAWAIRETWRVSGQIEKYDEKSNPASNLKKDLKGVKDFIIDWIETWKENTKENEYKFLGSKTDNKTFAKCRIKTGELYGQDLVDTFSLKVVPCQITFPTQNEKR